VADQSVEGILRLAADIDGADVGIFVDAGARQIERIAIHRIERDLKPDRLYLRLHQFVHRQRLHLARTGSRYRKGNLARKAAGLLQQLFGLLRIVFVDKRMSQPPLASASPLARFARACDFREACIRK
jgi:hypothetical protein